MPTLTASAPASISASAASPVAMLPATTSNSPERPLIRATISTTPREWPCAVSTTSTSAPAVDERLRRARARPGRRRPRRRRAAGPAGPSSTHGNSIRFWMSLTVIRPVQDAVRVDDRQLLDPVAVEQAARPRSSVVPTGAVTRPSAVISAETGCVDVLLEAEVAVREDADEAAAVVGDRHARDVVVLHQLERVGDERGRRQRERLDDHPRLGALDLVDLGHLLGDREVAVDDPDPALARERDRHPRLGDRVHRRRDDRDLERDRARQPRRGRDVVRQHRRLGRHEQDVVEGEALLRRTSRNGRARTRPAARLSRRPSATRYRAAAGRSAAGPRVEPTGASSLDRRHRAWSRRAWRGSKRPAPSSSVDAAPAATAARSASSCAAAGDRAARNAAEQHVARADPRDRLDPRRDRRGSGATARSSRSSAKQPALGGDDHVPGAAVGDPVEREHEVLVVVELLADERLRLPLVRRDEERLGLDAEPQRLAVAVERRGDLTAGELVDRLGVEVVRRRRAAASRRRRRARRPARGRRASRAAARAPRAARPAPTR